MKSMKAKAKAKKLNGKFAKVKFPPKEIAPADADLSQLRPPIDTSVSTLYRVSKLLENGSDEVRSILAYECDLVYECRICRSLFRSLVNFISHKRVYCKEKFDITFAKNSSHDCDVISTSRLVIESHEGKFEEACENNRILRSQVSKEEQKKDLTTVVSMLQKKQVENIQTDTERVYLEAVKSNPSAVYQTVEPAVSAEECADLMKAQVKELVDMKNETVVLGPNGICLKPSQESSNDSSPIQCNPNEEVDKVQESELACPVCYAKFSTKKTLAVHTRTLHTSHRLCYPCPCCSSTFANTWSVYRHLFKVHRKSNEQVRKLRSQIQEKAFIKDTTVAEDLQKEDANKASLMNSMLRVNETQEWIDHLESDMELQRCGGCGKRFDRKAALSSHSQYCHRRVAACENTTKVKKINKGIAEEANNNTTNESESKKNNVQVEAQVSSISSEIVSENETSIRVEAIATLSKADWDMMNLEKAAVQSECDGNSAVDNGNEVQESQEKDNPVVKEELPSKESLLSKDNAASKASHPSKDNAASKASLPSKDNAASKSNPFSKVSSISKVNLPTRDVIPSSTDNLPSMNDFSDQLEIVYTSINKSKTYFGSKKRKNKDTAKKLNTNTGNDAKAVEINVEDEAESETMNRVLLMEKKVASIVNLQKLQCLPCKRKFTSVNNLRRHAAIHIGWNRYQCKLCDYKCFVKCDCVAHCNKMHNAQNNRVVIDAMIIEIPDDQYTCDQNIVLKLTNLQEETGEMDAPEVVEVSITPEQVEAEVVMEEEDEKGKEVEVEAEMIEAKAGVDHKEVVQVNGETQETLRAQNTLGLDPDVRRMVMEVIFGSSEVNSTKQVQEDEAKAQNKEEEAVSKDSSIPLQQDNMKPQRPIRNKIKPLNKDFIYDLKEVTSRKDPLVMKTYGKLKKSPTQEEENGHKDLEQPSKRFKTMANDEISIICENGIIDKCNINLERDLKNSLSISQCHS